MAKKIMVVDDEEDIVITLTTFLEMKNYETIVARNGEEALKLLEKEKPDLIILDLMMPKVSGLQVLKVIKNDPELKNIPVMVLSAIGQNSDKSEEFWKLGLKSDDFISKPFDVTALVGRIEYLLRRDQYLSAKKSKNLGVKEQAKETAKIFSYDTPEETIRTFLEAYNSESFVAEYNSFSKQILSMYPPEDEYVASRMQVAMSEKKFNKKIYLDKVITRLEKGDKAIYIVVKKEKLGSSEKKEKIKFELIKEGNEWKILRIQPIGPV